MIRKRIAIFFVLFATLLLLVHAVVPHHHHKDHVCISIHHCQSDCAHQHCTPVNDHPHEGENDSEFCVLKQAVFIPSSQWNPFDKHSFGNDKPLSFLDFQALVFNIGWKAYLPGIVLSGHEITTPFIYYDFTVSSSGLRAPPAV